MYFLAHLPILRGFRMVSGGSVSAASYGQSEYTFAVLPSSLRPLTVGFRPSCRLMPFPHLRGWSSRSFMTYSDPRDFPNDYVFPLPDCMLCCVNPRLGLRHMNLCRRPFAASMVGSLRGPVTAESSFKCLDFFSDVDLRSPVQFLAPLAFRVKGDA